MSASPQIIEHTLPGKSLSFNTDSKILHKTREVFQSKVNLHPVIHWGQRWVDGVWVDWVRWEADILQPFFGIIEIWLKTLPSAATCVDGNKWVVAIVVKIQWDKYFHHTWEQVSPILCILRLLVINSPIFKQFTIYSSTLIINWSNYKFSCYVWPFSFPNFKWSYKTGNTSIPSNSDAG